MTPGASTLAVLGIRHSGLLYACVIPLLHTCCIYFAAFCYYFSQRRAIRTPTGAWKLLCASAASLKDPVQFRNAVTAPVTEEFAFRACLAPLWVLSGYSWAKTCVLTPLFFGTAHLYHLHQLVTFDNLQLIQAVQVVLVQFAYTWLFGWYATHLFLATGSIAAPILVHSLCNCTGLPPLGDMFVHPRLARLYLFLQAAGLLVFWLTFDFVVDPVRYR